MEKFIGALGNVEQGHVIIITGKSSKNAKRFDLNFQSTEAEDSKEIPFQLSVRFDEKVIKRCTKVNKIWNSKSCEAEENLIAKSSSMLIKPGENYKICFYMGDGALFVSINDRPFCTYSLNSPLADLKHLLIGMDHNKLFQFDHICVTRKNRSPKIVASTFSSLVPSKFKPGSVVVITAKASGSNQGFSLINIREAGTNNLILQLKVTTNDSTSMKRASTA